MMRSMTGFGRAETRSADGRQWVVECSSVNRKQLEVQLSLPREFPAEWEADLRRQAAVGVSRGRVQAQVRRGDQKAAGQAGTAVFDAQAAQIYLNQAQALALQLGTVNDLSLADLLRLPGVLQSEAAEELGEAERTAVTEALQQAMAAMVEMRGQEGAALQADIEMRLAEVEAVLEKVRLLAPQVTVNYREQLLKRLQQAVLDVALDDERLIKEVALFADRCDISEEIARAGIHLKQFRSIMADEEAVGRRLDFLMQEFFREFNTMGSKANHADLAHLVVSAKTALEKIREQLQNVE